MGEIRYGRGFPDGDRADAAALYDLAFAPKFKPAIADDQERVRWLAASMNPALAYAAHDGDQLVGIAGFHEGKDRSFIGGGWESLRSELGVFRAARAVAVFVLLERTPEEGELLMDGIVVAEDARGRGIGTGLFDCLARHAADAGSTSIRLDVVDTNPNARRLYERLGFEATKTEQVSWLRPIMGFSAVTTMVKPIR